MWNVLLGFLRSRFINANAIHTRNSTNTPFQFVPANAVKSDWKWKNRSFIDTTVRKSTWKNFNLLCLCLKNRCLCSRFVYILVWLLSGGEVYSFITSKTFCFTFFSLCYSLYGTVWGFFISLEGIKSKCQAKNEFYLWLLSIVTLKNNFTYQRKV